MSLRIRLARGGTKKRPFYRIVVAEGRSPRDGRFIEKVGAYNPLLPKSDENRVRMEEDRIAFWMERGAKPSDRVSRFLEVREILPKKVRENLEKAKPRKKTQERLEAAAKAKEEAAKAEAEAAKKQELEVQEGNEGESPREASSSADSSGEVSDESQAAAKPELEKPVETEAKHAEEKPAGEADGE